MAILGAVTSRSVSSVGSVTLRPSDLIRLVPEATLFPSASLLPADRPAGGAGPVAGAIVGRGGP